VQEKEKVSSDEVITFPYQVTDYAITTTNHKGSKKLLGSGVWSDVYHATPALPNPSSRPGPVTEASPPVTPHSRSSSTSTTASLPAIPRAYAIKTPSSAAAHKVLREEARILSYLSRMPGNEKHMVPFYGQDPRTDALVLKCMDNTLDSWLTTTLNPLPEPVRATTLAQTFPALAKQLLDALSWLSRHGVVHADIKPANMLLVSDPGSSVPDLVLTDFSSAILTLPTSSSSSSSSSSSTASSPNKTQGGGTWDFLSPHFFHTATRNAAPTPSADLWATAMTLLVLVLGASPYDFLAAHLFRRRECVKQGDPMAYIAYGDFAARNRKRIGMLSAALGVDVEAWFGLVLGKAGVGGVHVDVEGWKVRLLEGL
ncbi:kinase-like protein, partial [Massarina eburnea CBS 473.64]